MENDLGRCANHSFERSHRLCGTCGRAFCEDCLVFPFGPRKAPLCMQCAVVAGGLRKAAPVIPVRTKKEIDRINAEMTAAQLGTSFGASFGPTDFTSPVADPSRGGAAPGLPGPPDADGRKRGFGPFRRAS
ncbi:MAG: B-box zinc finger protein [Actinobacteria bacterium]|nr:B-box zinc finger protein [Actinomycetota bacterium]